LSVLSAPLPHLSDVQTLRLTGLEKTVSKAYGVNNAGLIVGEFRKAAGTTHAFRWNDGVLRDLGTLGGSNSSATAINSENKVVGWSETPPGTVRAFLWQSGVMTDLGTLGGAGSAAYGINGLGQVVGWSETSAGATHAFLWETGVMTDLGPGIARGRLLRYCPPVPSAVISSSSTPR
jgi:probable HAF family extracellular repeat protein